MRYVKIQFFVKGQNINTIDLNKDPSEFKLRHILTTIMHFFFIYDQNGDKK
jgi:hypothetical protein